MPKIHFYAMDGDVNKVKEELDNQVDVNFAEEDGTTPLHTACRRGHVDVVELLIQRGADIYAQTSIIKDTALLSAVMMAHSGIEKLAPEQHEAVFNKFFQIFELLLQREKELRQTYPAAYEEKLLLLDIPPANGRTPRGYLQRHVPELYKRLSNLDGIIFGEDSVAAIPAGVANTDIRMPDVVAGGAISTPFFDTTAVKTRHRRPHKSSEQPSPKLQPTSPLQPSNTNHSKAMHKSPSSIARGFWSAVREFFSDEENSEEASIPLLKKRHSD